VSIAFAGLDLVERISYEERDPDVSELGEGDRSEAEREAPFMT
jgi:hypothetical protein